MNYTQNLLKTGASTLNISLSETQLGQFERYAGLMLDWNRTHNLTRITDPAEVTRKHFLDSLSCLSVGHSLGARVVDVGSGAGFPGLALKIARPDLRLTLVESVRKKTDFLRHAVADLQLNEVTVLHQRAEDVGQDRRYRAQFDVAVARAVSNLAVLAEYLLPLLKINGVMIAQKGQTPHLEVKTAQPGITRLGGGVAAIQAVNVPYLAADRHLIVVSKIMATPNAYPRRAGLPAKDPLR